jgi:hypothetical protein
MRCDEFLLAIETGGFLTRIRARRHAAGCRRCAAEYAVFSAAMREWAAVEPLSAEAKKRWLAVAVEPERPPLRRDARKTLMAGAVAGACLIVICAIWAFRRVDESPARSAAQNDARRETRHLSPITIERIGPAKGQAILSSEIGRLDDELKELRRKIEEKRVQNQIVAALARFDEPLLPSVE